MSAPSPRTGSVEPELLGQIAQQLPHFVRLRQHIELAQTNGPGVRTLQRRHGPHERGLAGAFGPSRPNMPLGMVRERPASARTPFVYVFDRFWMTSSTDGLVGSGSCVN